MTDDHRLRIILDAKNDTQRAFMQVQGNLKTFQTKTQTAFLKAGGYAKAFTSQIFSMQGALAGVAGAAGLGLFIDKSLKAADVIGKTADRIGISTGALQEYRYAAGIAGVETAQLDKGIEKFTKNLGEARVGTGTLVTFLKKYDDQLLSNIQHAKSSDDALNLIYDAMGRASSAANRAALANAAFGRSGIAMTVMAKDGAAALARLRREARDLGIVMSDDMIRNAEKANDELSKLSQVIKIQFMSSVVGLAPEIANIAKATTDWWKANQDLVKSDVARWAGDIKNVILEIKDVYEGLPEGVVGAAGAGLVGRALFGPQAGAVIAMITLTSSKINQFKRDHPEIFGYKPGVPGHGVTGSFEIPTIVSKPTAHKPTPYSPPPPTPTGGPKNKEISQDLQEYYGWWSAYGDAVEDFYTTTSKVFLENTKSDIEKSQEAYAAMYETLRFDAAGYYAWRVSQIKKETDAYAEASGDQVLAHQVYVEKVKQLDQELAESSKETGGYMIEFSQRTAEAMEQNFSDYFLDIMQGRFDTFEDFVIGSV